MIDGLQADVVGLQEAELPLVEALDETGTWQSHWSPKGRNKPDGCLTLVRNGIDFSDQETHHYDDGSGHVVQTLRIGQAIFANTHIRWAPASDPEHAGVAQTQELLDLLGPDTPAVVFTDCNDRPGGPVRKLFEASGFVNLHDEEPTAFVNKEPVSLDLLAVRGLHAEYIGTDFTAVEIPNRACPSDHIPKMAYVDVD
jgi:hypothetical protein